MDNEKQSPESLGLANEIPKAVKYKRNLILYIAIGIISVLVISILIVMQSSTEPKIDNKVTDPQQQFEYITPKIYESSKKNYAKENSFNLAKANKEPNKVIDNEKINLNSRNSNSNIPQAVSEHNTGLLKEYFEQQALLKIKEEDTARLSNTGFAIKNIDFKAETAKAVQELASIKQNPESKLLKVGSIIPCVLVTAVNSDLPGMVVARVRENVFDTATGEHLLIPQGAVLTGDYSSEIIFGQNRAQIKFNNINFPETVDYPEGYSVNLGQLPGASLDGHTGLADQVNNHYDKVAIGISLSSLLAAISKDPIDEAGYRQRALNKTSENISEIGQKIADKQLNQKPTITIRSGAPFNIMVAKDLSLLPIRNGS